MTRKDRGPGQRIPGPREDDAPAKVIESSIRMVTDGTAVHPLQRFGRPSSFSLTHAELAAEVRRRRREGWQHWEIAARFDFTDVA